MALDSYWQVRKERELGRSDRSERQFEKRMKALYDGTIKDIDKMIADVYAKYGENGKITFQQLATADARRRMSRLESLKLDISKRLSAMNKKRVADAGDVIGEDYKNNYYNGVFDLQQAMGTGKPFGLIDDKTIKQVVGTKWLDGRNYSDRLWDDKNKLLNNLYTVIGQGIAQGLSYADLTKNLKDRMETSKYNSMRLIRTEMGYMRSRADRDAYEAAGIETYEFVSTLDNRTSDICMSMDGKVFPLSEMQPGVNAPPMHPNCRSTTVAVITATTLTSKGEEKEITLRGELRRAREEGKKTYLVPADLTYDKWKSAYVDGKKPANIETPVYNGPKTHTVSGVEVNLEELHRLSFEALNESVQLEAILTPELLRIADKNGVLTRGIKHRLKSLQSLTRKIETDYVLLKGKGLQTSLADVSGNKIKDTTRYTFILDENNFADKTYKIIADLESTGAKVIKFSNTFGKDTPYWGLNLQLQTASGSKYEVQFHTQQSLFVKEYENHPLYEEFRDPNTTPERIKELGEMMRDNNKVINLPQGIRDMYYEVKPMDEKEVPLEEILQPKKEEVKESVKLLDKPGPIDISKLKLVDTGNQPIELKYTGQSLSDFEKYPEVEFTTKWADEWFKDPEAFYQKYKDSSGEFYEGNREKIMRAVMTAVSLSLNKNMVYLEQFFEPIQSGSTKDPRKVMMEKNIDDYRKRYAAWKQDTINQRNIETTLRQNIAPKGNEELGLKYAESKEDYQRNAKVILNKYAEAAGISKEDIPESIKDIEPSKFDTIARYMQNHVTRDGTAVVDRYLNEKGFVKPLFKGLFDKPEVIPVKDVKFLSTTTRMGTKGIIELLYDHNLGAEPLFKDDHQFNSVLKVPLTSYRANTIKQTSNIPEVFKLTIQTDKLDANGYLIKETKYFFGDLETSNWVFEKQLLGGRENFVANVVDLDKIIKEERENKYKTFNQERISKMNDVITKYWKIDEMLPAEWNERILKETKELLDKSWVRTRMSVGTVLKVLEDGKIKGQMESNTSGGLLDKEFRTAASGFLFGNINAERILKKDYEIYGYIDNSDVAFDLIRDQGGISQYGKAIVQLKPEVKERTTFLMGDSLNVSGTVTPSAVVDPKLSSILPNSTCNGDDVPKKIEEYVKKNYIHSDKAHTLFELQQKVSPEQYVEAQIHGGVKLEDIESITLSYLDGDSPRLREIVEKAQEANIPVYLLQNAQVDRANKDRYEVFFMEDPSLVKNINMKYFEDEDYRKLRVTIEDGKVRFTKVEKGKPYY